MALWNDTKVGEELEECPVCLVNVSKRRKTTHVTACCETYKDFMEEQRLMKCPLYPLHIIPEKNLNHHLEGNCEEAMNLLRKYFQKDELLTENIIVPPSFLADVPKNILDDNGRKLLFTLKRDLKGNDISENREYYPRREENELPKKPVVEAIEADGTSQVQ